jgi:hypothetical protein
VTYVAQVLKRNRTLKTLNPSSVNRAPNRGSASICLRSLVRASLILHISGSPDGPVAILSPRTDDTSSSRSRRACIPSSLARWRRQRRRAPFEKPLRKMVGELSAGELSAEERTEAESVESGYETLRKPSSNRRSQFSHRAPTTPLQAARGGLAYPRRWQGGDDPLRKMVGELSAGELSAEERTEAESVESG